MRLIDESERQPDREPDRADDEAFGREHRADLPPRHAEVAQHAELAAPRERERAERRRQADEADHDGSELERVGDGERPIERPQRQAANFARRCDLEPIAARNIAPQRRFDCGQVGAFGEPQRAVGDGAIAGHFDIARELDRDRALLPRVIAPDAADGEARWLSRRSAAR